MAPKHFLSKFLPLWLCCLNNEVTESDAGSQYKTSVTRIQHPSKTSSDWESLQWDDASSSLEIAPSDFKCLVSWNPPTSPKVQGLIHRGGGTRRQRWCSPCTQSWAFQQAGVFVKLTLMVHSFYQLGKRNIKKKARFKQSHGWIFYRLLILDCSKLEQPPLLEFSHWA